MSRQECEHFANMVNIITLYARDSLEDKWSMLFTHFYLMYEKKGNLAYISSKQVIGTLTLNS